MLERDAILSKISIVRNCLKSIEKATGGNANRLEDAFVQDVVVLNLQRAVQACIDMANLVISEKGLSLPTTYKQCFEILAREGLIGRELCDRMIKMAGFRNIAIHDYRALDLEILKSIVKKHLGDLEMFCTAIFGIV